MSYNGSGTFVINSAGMPLVPFQRDLSSTFNALTADLATGLSTAITKDGQTTTTALITFAAGISSTLATDATSISTGSILTLGGLGVTKAAWIGGLINVAGAATLQSTLAVTGTSTMAAINASGNISVNSGVILLTAATGAINMAGALTLAPASANPLITLTDVTKGSAYLQGGVNTGGTGAGDYWLFNVPTSRGLSWAVNNVSVLNVNSTVAYLNTALSQSVAANSDWAATFQNTGSTDANGLYVNLGASATGIPFRVDKNGSALLTVSNAGAVTIPGQLAVGGTGFNNSAFAVNGTGKTYFATFSDFTTTTLTIAGSGGVITLTPTTSISVAGALGVTSTAEACLTISRSTDATCAITLSRSGGANSWGVYRYGSSGSDKFAIGRIGASEDFIISTAGAVTIPGTLNVGTGNTTEATAQLTVQAAGYGGYHWADGTAYYIGQNSAVRSLRIYSSSYTAGVNLAAGGTSWGTFSDERLKYDIEPITDGLNKLNGIRCVSYRLIDVDAPDSQKKLGVIAQDLVGVVDEVIDATKRNGDETDYMSVRYTELIPVLIKAIQELAADFQSYKSSHP